MKSKLSDYSLFDSPAREGKPHISMRVRFAARVFQGITAALELIVISRFRYDFATARGLLGAWSGTYWMLYAAIMMAICMIGYHYIPVVRKKWSFKREMAVEIAIDGFLFALFVGTFVALLLPSGTCPSGAFNGQCDAFNWTTVFHLLSICFWGFMMAIGIKDLRRGLAGPQTMHLSLSTLNRLNGGGH